MLIVYKCKLIRAIYPDKRNKLIRRLASWIRICILSDCGMRCAKSSQRKTIASKVQAIRNAAKQKCDYVRMQVPE
jgi:hypothetical protein